MGEGEKVNNQKKIEDNIKQVVKNKSWKVAGRYLIKSGKDLAEMKYMTLPVFTKNEPKNRHMEPNQSST